MASLSGSTSARPNIYVTEPYRQELEKNEWKKEFLNNFSVKKLYK